MASATQMDMANTSASAPQLPTLEKAQSQFELGVALSLAFWPALTLAVQNNWGGPASSDKRDWFGGEIVSLFETRVDTDLEDVETVLLQVMQDEFEVVVDDESAFEVAEQICRLRVLCGRGEFGEVEAMSERWERRKGKEEKVKAVEGGEEDQDTDDYDSDDVESEDGDGDVEMGGAPLKAPKEKAAPQIDEDGFETVVSKKKR